MIKQEQLKAYREAFLKDPQCQATAYAATTNGIEDACRDPHVDARHPFAFSVTTKMGDITYQKSSGRCWMFASLNAARNEAIKKNNLKTLEYSQTYTFFWDKLEKANAFLEAIIKTADQDLKSRLLCHLLRDPIQDGGQWDMFSGILKKYGIVPKSVMPETFNSSNSRQMVEYITSKLREYACELRTMIAEGKSTEAVEKRKEEMLGYVYNVLVKTLGLPPERFVFEYTDKDDNFHRTKEMTPKEFFDSFVGWNLDDKVSVINAPTEDKPYYRTYTVKFLSTVVEGQPINYLNVPMEELKKAAIRALKDGVPVWFGCDVARFLDNKKGIMDLDQYQYGALLGEDLKMTKAQRLDYGDSLLTHAMVLTGVNLNEDGNPLTWRVENSWGDKVGKKGIYSMADSWFDEFTYEVMVDKKYLDEKMLKALETPVIELEPWDPMGALA